MEKRLPNRLWEWTNRLGLCPLKVRIPLFEGTGPGGALFSLGFRTAKIAALL